MLLPAGDMMELLETIGCGGAGAGAGVESDAVEPVEAILQGVDPDGAACEGLRSETKQTDGELYVPRVHQFQLYIY